MIVDYKHRPERWINIFSPNDIISGDLTFYDAASPDQATRVFNIEDRNALTPLLAHNQYWRDPTFRATLCGTVTGRPVFHPVFHPAIAPAVRRPEREPAAVP